MPHIPDGKLIQERKNSLAAACRRFWRGLPNCRQGRFSATHARAQTFRQHDLAYALETA